MAEGVKEYQEKAPGKKGAFRVLIFGVVLLALLWCVPGIFSGFFSGIPYLLSVWQLAVFVLAAGFVWKYRLTYAQDYRYLLRGTHFVIRIARKGGDVTVADLDLSRTTRLCPASDLSADALKGVVRFGVSDVNAAYYFEFPAENGKNSFLAQPSDEFVKLLKQIPLDKSDEM